MPNKIDDAMATMVKNLEEKTGKTMAQWVAIAKVAGDIKHGQVVTMLKQKHGLGHGYANLVAHTAKGAAGAEAPAEEDLVASQYAGEKAGLKPIYDKLMKEIAKFGEDVEVSPKKAYVSLRRNKQFALIQPTTKTRMDVGIQLKGVPVTARLEASGSFNAMVSHRVRVESAGDVDKDLIAWLKQAYEAG